MFADTVLCYIKPAVALGGVAAGGMCWSREWGLCLTGGDVVAWVLLLAEEEVDGRS